MDMLCIEAVVGELRGRIRGAAVSKIYQPGPHEIVLRLWSGRENLRLLISVDPHASRLHLTTANLPNPQAPPRFCQLLRSRLSRLLDMERIDGDRCVRLLFAGGGGEHWLLMAELVGTRANLVLVDAAGRIVDALHRRSEAGREVAPGRPYFPPERSARFDLATSLPKIPSAVPLRAWLLDYVTPMTLVVAEDLTAAIGAGMSPEQALERFRHRWVEREFEPLIVTRGERQVLTPLLPEFLELGGVRRFESFSEAADAFYARESAAETFGGGQADLARVVGKGIERLQKRLRHIAEEETKASDCDRQRQLGELLLANMHCLRRGLTKVVLTDWYTEPPVEVAIPLDPAISPQENAERYFRRHRKGRRGREHTVRRRAETLSEIEWLEGVALSVEEAGTPAEFEAVRQELADAGLLRRPSGSISGCRLPAPHEQLGSAITPGGYRLFWGKNNRSNDHVSRQLTTPRDLWFHAHGLPGCHLVLKRGERGGDVPEEDILRAASIAAAHSRAKNAGKAEVMVAEGRWVKKPAGVKPGLVTVERYRTVVVRPARESDDGGSGRDLPSTSSDAAE